MKNSFIYVITNSLIDRVKFVKEEDLEFDPENDNTIAEFMFRNICLPYETNHTSLWYYARSWGKENTYLSQKF